MDNKYYTPELSEFGIDFEYQYFRSNGAGNFWLDDKITFFSEITEGGIEELLNNKLIRVKHLTHSDLDELGWEVTKLRWQLKLKKTSRYLLITDIHTSKEDIPIPNPNRGAISIQDTTDNQYLFLGYIKNKSELKKLMQQLNIK